MTEGVFFLGLTLVFSIAYTQPPLYSSNQNTKFLHGLAIAGLGNLKADWLVNTHNPLPVFSTLVQWTYQWTHPWAFYGIYALLAGVYLYSVITVTESLYPVRRFPFGKALPTGRIFFPYFAGVLLLHTLPLSIAGFDFGREFHWGVAGQSLLNTTLQPSTFGVFALWSIVPYLQRRYGRAILWLCVPVVFHSVYLVSALVWGSVYLWQAWRDGWRWSQLAGVALLAGAIVGPILLYNAIVFRPTEMHLWQQAQEILVNFRIPHHSRPQVWLRDIATYVQGMVMGVGVYLSRRTRLLPILGSGFACVMGATILQLAINHPSLALLAPWRLSVFLVPISTSLIVAWLCQSYYNVQSKRGVQISVAAIALMILLGAASQRNMMTRVDHGAAMMAFVEKHQQPGQVYLIPPTLQSFRLRTGAPVFVTLKTHPYKDVEVLEWYRRVQLAQKLYNSTGRDRCRQIRQLAQTYRFTHVVTPREPKPTVCPQMKTVYGDSEYGIEEVPIVGDVVPIDSSEFGE